MRPPHDESAAQFSASNADAGGVFQPFDDVELGGLPSRSKSGQYGGKNRYTYAKC